MPGHPAPDGRWQRGEQLAGLYLAQDPDTVWAEWYRALAELGEPPDRAAPARPVAVLAEPAARRRPARGPRRCERSACRTSSPIAAQWPAFQDAGARLAADGFEGVLFCSSARPAGLCVCVFGTGDGFAGRAARSGSPERISAAPVPPRGMRT